MSGYCAGRLPYSPSPSFSPHVDYQAMDDFSGESWPLEENDSPSRFIHKIYPSKGSTVPYTTTEPPVAGILSLHNYRKSLSHDCDSSWLQLDDSTVEGKTLRRKNAATNLNENDLCHSQCHGHVSTPSTASTSTSTSTSTSSNPPSLSRSDSRSNSPSTLNDLDPSDSDPCNPAAEPAECAPIPLATPRPRTSPASTTMMYEGTPFEIMNPHESLVVSRIESYIPEPEPSIRENGERWFDPTATGYDYRFGLDPDPDPRALEAIEEALYAHWNETLNNPTAVVYSDYKPKRKPATLLKNRRGQGHGPNQGHGQGQGHSRKVSASFKRLKSFFVFR
ncbi:hypothetical protein BDW74DRAFT_147352 [Aspergillus multicolor]|uniref:oxidoreductase, short-chain dehydrogenase/reductase family n=1 Tax=Aspergillus multicolor TaxID=41759 RepID=UPI003CCD00E3